MTSHFDRRAFLKGATLGITALGAATLPVVLAQTGQRNTDFTMRYHLGTLWAGSVRTKPFTERLDAAQKGGFRSMSLFPLDYKKFTAQGLTGSEMGKRAADAGVPIVVLDPLTRWLPKSDLPADLPADVREFHSFDEDAYFRAAEALGVRAVNMFEPWGEVYPIEEAAESFARVCDRARDLGMTVHLEFMPFTGIKSLRTAWDIVRTADRPNGNIMFDYWHFMRSDPDLKLLSTIPGSRIAMVQVTDAHAKPQAATLLDDCMHHRLLPGEGAFPIIEITRVLRSIGAGADMGLEIFSDTFDKLPAREAGQRGGDSMRRLLTNVV